MRICSGAGCLRAVADAVRFCDECKPIRAVSDDIKTHTYGYDAELDKLLTGTRWRSVRHSIIQRDPLCTRCDLRISVEVDHIVPAREAIAQARLSGLWPTDRYAGYYFKSNLHGLCVPCHRAKTLEDKAHIGDWPDVIAREQAAPKKRWSF